jgi:hypothetical protein
VHFAYVFTVINYSPLCEGNAQAKGPDGGFYWAKNLFIDLSTLSLTLFVCVVTMSSMSFAMEKPRIGGLLCRQPCLLVVDGITPLPQT